MNRISFTLPDVGLKEFKGLAYVEDGDLVLKISTSYIGLIKAGEEVIKVEPGALEELRIKRGWFRDKLILKPWHAELLDMIPGEHRAQIELKVQRKQRKELEGLVQEYDPLF